MEKPSFEIASTSEALAQLRLKRREESSQHSSEKKAPTLQEIEAEAAPFEEDVQEAVVEAKTGTCGMNFQFFHSRCCLSHSILIICCIKWINKNILLILRKCKLSGKTIQALTNFVRLEVGKDNGMYEYEVRFEPTAHSNQLRFALLNQQIEVIGRTRTFDGVKLCLPIQLPERVTQLTSVNSNDNTPVVLTIIYKGKRKFAECLQFYGILFANIMKILKFVRFGTKDFDPTAPKVIPQHKLEIWPGYVTGLYKNCVVNADATEMIV